MKMVNVSLSTRIVPPKQPRAFRVDVNLQVPPCRKEKRSSGSNQDYKYRKTYDIKHVITPMNEEKFSAMRKIISVVYGVPDEDFAKGTVRHTVLELFCVGKLSIKTD
jgi:hypothetical protein